MAEIDKITLNNIRGLLEEVLMNLENGPHSLYAWADSEQGLIRETLQDLVYDMGIEIPENEFEDE